MNGEGQKTGVRRPMNAFLIFCKLNRSKEREKNPDMDNRSITRILGDKWAKMPPEEKAVFNNMAKETKDAFMRANPDYKWHGSDKTQSNGKSSVTNTTASANSKPLPEVVKDTGTSASKSSDTESMGGLNLLLRAGQESGGSSQRKLLSPSTSVSESLSHAAVSSHAKTACSSDKASLQDAQDMSRRMSPGLETNSALLQLAEMCTSELYSSAPDNTSISTFNTHASSPLPPPKKRARQWSLDCSQGGVKEDSQKSDFRRNSAKHTSITKKTDSGGGKKQRNTSKHIQSASHGNGESSSSHTFSNSDWKQTESSLSTQLLTPLTSSQPLLKVDQESRKNTPAICEMPVKSFRGEGRPSGGRPPPHSLPPPDLFSSYAHRDNINPPYQSVLSQMDQNWRNSQDGILLDFSQNSSKQTTESFRCDSQLLEKKPDVGSFFSEGKIASLLSSSFALTRSGSLPVKSEFLDMNKKSDSHISPSYSQVAEKISSFEKPAPSGSLGTDVRPPKANPAPSGVSHSFTEGKVKKKWTQRMLVQAKEEEESQSLQGANAADKIWSSTRDTSHYTEPIKSEYSSHPADTVKLEHSEHHRSPAVQGRENMFTSVKTDIKSESHSLFKNEGCYKSAAPRDFSIQNSNTSSRPSVKPEALQSNTLYRALMGQTPEGQFIMSANATKDVANGYNNKNPDNIIQKSEGNQPVFSPIAECGKKMVDHIVERLFQTGLAGDVNYSDIIMKSSLEHTVPKRERRTPVRDGRFFESPSVKNLSDVPGLFTSTLQASASSLVEKVVKEMCRIPSSQEISHDIKNPATLKDPGDDHGNSFNQRHADIQKSSTPQNESNTGDIEGKELNALSAETTEDSNSTDILEAFQPVRKSRRANRGQKYQALIKEGIIQPSKERLAARNAERSLKSCSSREDIEKSEPKRLMKRSQSEREPPSTSLVNSDNLAVGRANSEIVPEMEFDLEKEIASLPTCSYDQFEKKKLQSNRRLSEITMQKAESKSCSRPKAVAKTDRNQLDLKGPKKSEGGYNAKKEFLGKTGKGQTASCHASIKDLGCHTVHIPLIKESHPIVGLTGSRKRKARRHCITRISVATPQEADTKAKCPSLGNIAKNQISEDKDDKQPTSINYTKKQTLQDITVSHSTELECKKTERERFKTICPMPFPTSEHIGVKDHTITRKRDTIEQEVSPLKTVSLNSEHIADSARQGTSLAQQNFPALTLLSSVMIDSEKAVSPACQNKALLTTQSPMPAALAKPWPMGVESIHMSSQSSLHPSSMSNTFPNLASATSQMRHMASSSLPHWTTGLQASSHTTPVHQTISSLPTSSTYSSMSEMRNLSYPHSNFVMSSSPLSSSSASSISSSSSSYRLTPAVENLFTSSSTSISSSSLYHPPNTVCSTVTSIPMKRPSPTTVPSAFVISTLTSSKPPQNKPASWTQSNSHKGPKKQSTVRRKKPLKDISMTEGKNELETQAVSTNSQEKTLNPGTKKLVKLLLKGNGVDEPVSESGMEGTSQIKSPGLSHEMANLTRKSTEQVQSSKMKPVPRIIKAGEHPNSMQRPPFNSSHYLSLKSQLELGKSYMSDKQLETGIAKNRKPTIWDHLNSPSFLPITSSRTHQNIPPPAKKSCHESAPSTQLVIPSCSKSAAQKLRANQKGLSRDSVGSDTESASEDTEEHVSSDTDSAEETETSSSHPAAPNSSSQNIVNVASCPQLVMSSHPNPASGNESTMVVNGQTITSISCSLATTRPVPNSQPRSQSFSHQTKITDISNPLSFHARPVFNQQPNSHQMSMSSDGHLSHNSSHTVPTVPLKSPSSQPNVLYTGCNVTSTISASQLSPVPTVSISAQSGVSQPPQAFHMPVMSTAATTVTTQDVPKGAAKEGELAIATISTSRVPSVIERHTSSASLDPVNFDVRVSSSLIEGASTLVSSSSYLPGSPSIAVVQS